MAKTVKREELLALIERCGEFLTQVGAASEADRIFTNSAADMDRAEDILTRLYSGAKHIVLDAHALGVANDAMMRLAGAWVGQVADIEFSCFTHQVGVRRFCLTNKKYFEGHDDRKGEPLYRVNNVLEHFNAAVRHVRKNANRILRTQSHPEMIGGRGHRPYGSHNSSIKNFQLATLEA